MAVLMNKVQNKHYSLLLQDDADPNEHILRIRNEKMTVSDEADDDEEDEDEDDDDDDGFKSMIGEDEDEQDVDDDGDDDDDVDVDEVEGSDEEIFSSNQHRTLSNDGVRHGGPSNYGRTNDYHLLSNNEPDHKATSSLDASLNAVWTPTPMSPVRRAFFLASIMFGVLVVAMFLWALPCDVQPCENELKLKPRQWFTEIDHIGMNYTQLLEKINGHLSLFISFYKMETFSDISHKNGTSAPSEPKVNITPGSCGLLSLDEKMGKQSWKMDLLECPLHINCDLLDATGDGLPDCLILGHVSMALMFEPIYGSIFWHIHIHNQEEGSGRNFDPNEYSYDLPLVLQDLNSDGFSELLFPVAQLVSTPIFGGGGKRSHLLLVSGRSGAVLGKPFSISNCFKIIELFREDASVGYTCMMDNRSELTGKIPLATLLSEFGKDFFGERFRNDTFLKVQTTPESNDAVCQIRHVVEGKCPYCKTRVEFGLSSDNPVNREYEYASIVSWKILAYNNACKGAIMKLWKWDPTSLEAAFQESSPSPTLTDSGAADRRSKSLPLPMGEDDVDFKIDDPSRGREAYPSIYDDNDDLGSTFPGGKFPFGEKYREGTRNDFKPSPVEGTGPSYLRRQRRDGGPLYSSQNKDRRMEESHQGKKRVYEHPTIYNHNGKQTSGSHGNLNANTPVTAAASVRGSGTTIGTTSSTTSTVTAPSGSRLQKLEEVLMLLTFNGSDWVTKELGSMVVYQLCQVECIPSHISQKESVLIDTSSLRFEDWNVYVSSSSFSSVREEGENATSVTWSLESYVRKLITPAGTY